MSWVELHTPNSILQTKKGIALIITVFAIMVFGVLGWTLATLNSGGFMTNLRNLYGERATAVAEAGSQWMLTQLSKNPSSVTKGTTYTHTINFGQYDVLYRDPTGSETGTYVVVATGYAPSKANYSAQRQVSSQCGAVFSYYTESEGVSSIATTTLTDKATLTFIPPAGDFLIIASANITESATKQFEANLVVDGTAYHLQTITLLGTVMLYRTVGFSKKVTLTNASHTIKIQFREVGGGTAYIQNARIAAIALTTSDLQYAESETTTSNTTTTYTDKVSLTFTPAATADYYILGTGDFNVPSTSSNAYCRTSNAGTTTEAESYVTGIATTDYYPFTSGRKYTSLLSGAQTFKIQYKKGTANAILRYCHLPAVRLTNFTNYYAEAETVTSTTAITYQDKTTLTFTPPAAGAYLIIASAQVLSAVANKYVVLTRLNIDGTDLTPEQQFYTKAATDWVSYFAMRKVNLTAASHTIKIQYCTNNASGAASIRNARIIALTPIIRWSEI